MAVILDGVFAPELSSLVGLPKDIYVGSLASAPQESLGRYNSLVSTRGGPFACLNRWAHRASHQRASSQVGV